MSSWATPATPHPPRLRVADQVLRDPLALCLESSKQIPSALFSHQHLATKPAFFSHQLMPPVAVCCMYRNAENATRTYTGKHRPHKWWETRRECGRLTVLGTLARSGLHKIRRVFLISARLYMILPTPTIKKRRAVSGTKRLESAWDTVAVAKQTNRLPGVVVPPSHASAGRGII